MNKVLLIATITICSNLVWSATSKSIQDKLIDLIQQNNLNELESLLALNPSIDITDSKNRMSYSPLEVALKENKSQALEVMLKNRPDLDLMTRPENSIQPPIEFAIENANEETFRLLIEQSNHWQLLEKSSVGSFSPLEFAIFTDQYKKLELLLAYSPESDLFNPHNEGGNTAIKYAIMRDSLEATKLILKARPGLDAYALDEKKLRSAYDYARDRDSVLIAKELSEHQQKLNNEAKSFFTEFPAPVSPIYQKALVDHPLNSSDLVLLNQCQDNTFFIGLKGSTTDKGQHFRIKLKDEKACNQALTLFKQELTNNPTLALFSSKRKNHLAMQNGFYSEGIFNSEFFHTN